MNIPATAQEIFNVVLRERRIPWTPEHMDDEAYGLRCEMHMAGWGNLQVCGATTEDTSEYYEKGLLAPGVDYDALERW